MVEISYTSGVYSLRAEQFLRGSHEKIADYFSRPENLNELTPEDMDFKITSRHLPEKTYAGQIITYDIEILPGIRSAWVTEITRMEEGTMFIDEQRFGPYRMWHHEHHFEKIDENTVKMTDLISYKLPFGFLGRMVAGKIIQNKLRKIFTYRFQRCENLFT